MAWVGRPSTPMSLIFTVATKPVRPSEVEAKFESPPDVIVARSIKPAPRTTSAEKTVRDLPDSVLAAELQRRGWIVVEP